MTTDLSAARALLESWALPPGSALLCAVSGGRDSMVLLHFLLHAGFAVTAAHFHHGLRAAADRDEALVRETCGKWGVPLTVGRGDTRAFARREGLSIEEAARALRYAFLRQAMAAENCAFLAVGHHQADQAETILLHLTRGAGMDGLRGMNARRGRILRPLLTTAPAALEAYAAAWRVPFQEDETNEDLRFARNRVRRRVLPELAAINPQVLKAVARAGDILAAEGEFLDQAAERALPPVRETETGLCLSLRDFQAMEPTLRLRALRLLLNRLPVGMKNISADHLRSAANLAPGGALDLPGGVHISARQGALRLDLRPPAGEAVPLAVPGETVWGSLRLCCAGPAGQYTAAPWSPRDRLDGRTVKRLLRDQGVPDYLRALCPLILLNGSPIVLCGPFGILRGKSCPPAFTLRVTHIKKSQFDFVCPNECSE